MRKIFIVAFFLFAEASAQTIYPSGVTNCIARYDFTTSEATITALPDVSGNGNNSSEVEDLTTELSWRNHPGKAMQFNGTSSYALIPNSSSLTPSSEVTMVALVKFNGYYDGTCQFTQVVCKGSPGYIPGQYGLGVTDDIYDNDCYGFDPTHHQLVGYFNNSYYTAGMLPDAGNYIDTGKWYFLAIVFGGTNLQYYQVPMDTGMYYSSTPAIYSSPEFSGSLDANSQDISIGKHLNPIYPYWFKGSMDEVALFDRALSEKEIQSIYHYLWTEDITSIEKVEEPLSDFLLYPNPNKGIFTVSGKAKNSDICSVEVNNVIGQVIYSESVLPKNGHVNAKIELSKKIASGNYFLIIKQSGNTMVRSFAIP